jgi:hypothetical protein
MGMGMGMQLSRLLRILRWLNEACFASNVDLEHA